MWLVSMAIFGLVLAGVGLYLQDVTAQKRKKAQDLPGEDHRPADEQAVDGCRYRVIRSG